MKDATINRRLVTVRELADRIFVTPRSIQNWYRAGRIPHIRISPRCIRFDADEVEAALRSH